MLNPKLKLNDEIFHEDVETKSNRTGFGEALLKVGENNVNVVALCADLTSSTRTDLFAKKFPERFIQMGIAEQNMASVAAGMAMEGKVPFIVSHAIFSPSRNWDQIRVSICLPNLNVKIVGTHLGFSNGQDGAVAESLEDLGLMRVLPNMTVVQPTDAIETYKAVIESVKVNGPVYLRISKEATPVITTESTPFEIGKAQILVEGKDITLISSGPITYETLLAARDLKAKNNIEAEVIACPTIKPLDQETILNSVRKTGKVVTIEEHQIIGGLGSSIAELISEQFPVKLKRLGMKDCFGESGTYQELKDKYGLNPHNIVKEVLTFIKDL